MRWLLSLSLTLPLLLVACDSDDDSDDTIEPAGTPAATQPAQTPSAASPTATTPGGGGGPVDDDDDDRNDDDLDDIGSIEGIRELIGSVANIDPNVIQDIELDDRRLTIILSEDDSFAETNDVETICNDLNRAIGFTDLTIVIESSTGTTLAECTFTG